MDKKKSFLKPVQLLVASLLASGAAGSVNPQTVEAYVNNEQAQKTSSATQNLLLTNSEQEGPTPLGHRSHSSHASHVSHQSGFMGQ